MESVLGRYRNLIILVGVLFLQVLGLAMQVKRAAAMTQDTRLIRIWAVGALTPFERALVWIQNGTGNLWHNYFYLRGVRAENRQLKAADRADAAASRCASAKTPPRPAACKPCWPSRNSSSPKPWPPRSSDRAAAICRASSTSTRGRMSGIKRDMAVITADGIVGKVLLVYPVGVASAADQRSDQRRGRDSGEIALAGRFARKRRTAKSCSNAS